MTSRQALPPPEVIADSGQVVVVAPWAGAEELQGHLRRSGFPATLHLDPKHREARLVLWSPAEPDAVRAAVDRWR
jgi:hypothetical protein